MRRLAGLIARTLYRVLLWAVRRQEALLVVLHRASGRFVMVGDEVVEQPDGFDELYELAGSYTGMFVLNERTTVDGAMTVLFAMYSLLAASGKLMPSLHGTVLSRKQHNYRVKLAYTFTFIRLPDQGVTAADTESALEYAQKVMTSASMEPPA